MRRTVLLTLASAVLLHTPASSGSRSAASMTTVARLHDDSPPLPPPGEMDLLASGPWTGRDSTRVVWVRAGLRDALDAILGSARSGEPEDDLERIVRAAELLELGERATFPFHAAAQGESETLEVEILSDLGFFLRIHGAGAPFRVVRDALEAYWRNSLGTIDGPVGFSLQEVAWPRGSPPVLQLAYRTDKEFSCIRYRIEAELARTADSLHLELLGISPPGPICSPAFGPAIGATDLDLRPASYPLSIRYREVVDQYRLVLTDTTAQLESVRSTFTHVDERQLLRYPSNSFALYCGTTAGRRSWCEQLRAWVAGRYGISVHEFPPEGVIPFQRGIGTHHEERFYFQYADTSALESVRSCFRELEAALAGLKGVSVTIELWTGELIPAWGSHHQGVDETAPIIQQVSCLPQLPPPAADSLSLEWVQAEPYSSNYYIYGMSCEVERERQERFRRAQERADREQRASPADTTPDRAPAMLLPDVWREAAQRNFSNPVVLPPNTSRSAASRSRLHHDLREWQCRGGRTLGDAEKHPGVAWYWIEHEGNWYYLLPETTAEAVEAYLELVDRNGEELVWSAHERPERGPEPVVVGPDRLAIPGFYLYRWRP